MHRPGFDPEFGLDLDLDGDRHVLLGRLALRECRLRGLTQEDAEDVAGTAWIKIERAKERVPAERFGAYARTAIENLVIDRVHSPARILAKRIDIVIARSRGDGADDALDAWAVGAATAVGLRAMRKVPPLAGSEVGGLSMSDFLYGNRGLAGTNPQEVSTRDVLRRFFGWLGRPVERTALIGLLAPYLVERPREVPLDDHAELAVAPKEPETPLGGFWESIEGLPTEKMRASILLEMDDPLLRDLHPQARARLAVLIPSWNGPPPLATMDLPADDDLVAARLGIGKGALQTTRHRAKAILRPALAALLDLPPSGPGKG